MPNTVFWRAFRYFVCAVSVFCNFEVAIAEVNSVRLSNGEYPPYSSEALPHGGSVSRIVREAFALSGITVRYDFQSWQSGFEKAENGELDGTIAWSRTPEREQSFYFSDPVVPGYEVIFHPANAPIEWQQLSDLSHLKIGATVGYNYGPEFERLASEGVLDVHWISTDIENLRKLARGDIQAFPSDLEVGLHLLRQHEDLAGKIGHSPKSFLSIPLHLLISRNGSKDGEELVKKFNAGLEQLRISGKIDEFLAEGRVDQ